MTFANVTGAAPKNSSNHKTFIVMSLLVRNEEDILPQMLEYHRAQGIDHFIVTDNLSEDSTPEILEKYRRRGLVTLIHENQDNYNQQAWVTRMARMAAFAPFRADWILHSDADEFWLANDYTLREFFACIPLEVNIVVANRHDFVCVRNSGKKWFERMIYRKAVSLSPKGTPLPPKVAHRPHPEAFVTQGNHEVLGLDPRIAIDNGIEILHFPVRTQAQLERKIRKGGAAYERNTILPKTIAVGWRRLYKELRDKGTLSTYFNEISLSPEEAHARALSGELILDRRIMNELASMSNDLHVPYT